MHDFYCNFKAFSRLQTYNDNLIRTPKLYVFDRYSMLFFFVLGINYKPISRGCKATLLFAKIAMAIWFQVSGSMFSFL